jgi:transposase InsO family protein
MMYRRLHEQGEVRERRAQAVHPARVKPELVASAPKQVWSWDITKLHGPKKWAYCYLYVILDIYSRYVSGWMFAPNERAVLVEKLISDTFHKQGVDPDQLTLHTDRGSSVASKPVAFLLADLGVTTTHSRPHVPNDNPFSESQFKTLKYRPDFPKTSNNLEHSAQDSSLSTTTNIATAGLVGTHLPEFTTAPPNRSEPNEAKHLTWPTKLIQNDSYTDHPAHFESRKPPGSTNQSRRPPKPPAGSAGRCNVP